MIGCLPGLNPGPRRNFRRQRRLVYHSFPACSFACWLLRLSSLLVYLLMLHTVDSRDALFWLDGIPMPSSSTVGFAIRKARPQQEPVRSQIYSEPSPCLMLESFRKTRMGNSACAYLQTTSSGAAPVLVCSKPRTNHCCPVGLHGYDLGRSHSSLAVFSINGREDCQLYGEIWSLQTCCWILSQGDMKLPLQHGEVECVCERERGRRTKGEELSACCWVEF